MANSNVMSEVGVRIGGYVTRHPRLVAMLLALLLLLAVQDGVAAADGTFTEPTAEGAVDFGPDPEED